MRIKIQIGLVILCAYSFGYSSSLRIQTLDRGLSAPVNLVVAFVGVLSLVGLLLIGILGKPD
jgi:hypothetical protein